jgi:hypothetical protein
MTWTKIVTANEPSDTTAVAIREVFEPNLITLLSGIRYSRGMLKVTVRNSRYYLLGPRDFSRVPPLLFLVFRSHACTLFQGGQ